MNVVSQVNELVVRTLGPGDSRVEEWPLVRSPLPTLGLCFAYVLTVKIFGPAFMKSRQPYNIRWLMIIYNLSMVVVSTWLVYRLGIHGWFGKYDYRCQPVDYSDSLDAIGMATAAYWYYITKFVEFADTIFFVLRKKNTHITTLHVIHHGIMPMSVWWGVKFTPGGHSTFFAFINSFVHILMYTYYGLAAIGPHMNKYLFWKKHMTSIQMVQFIAIFVHSFQLLFRECNYPRGFMWWIGFHAVLFWFLFWDFFVYTYGGGKRRKSSSSFIKPSLPCTLDNSTLHQQSAHDDQPLSESNPSKNPSENRSTRLRLRQQDSEDDHGAKDL